MQYILLGCITISLLLCATWYYYRPSDSKPGTVIILNGPSGSGKSSIQRAFQQLNMPDLWVAIGIDNFFDNVMPEITPENMDTWKSPNPIRWIENTKDTTNNNIITLHVGVKGKKVAYAMNSAIAAYAQEGCNVIVDYIAYDQTWLHDLQKKLHNIPTYYVAVDIPLSVLEEREAKRGTSPAGHARSHYDTVYGDMSYDVRVDTYHNTPQETAQMIQSAIQEKKTI